MKESAIAGHGTGFHATQMIVYQSSLLCDIQPSEIEFSTKRIEVPSVLHKMTE